MGLWNARMATLVAMFCTGVAFVAPLYACGQSGGAQAAEVVSEAVKKQQHAHVRHVNPTAIQHASRQAASEPARPAAAEAKKEPLQSKKVEVDIKTLETRLKNTDAIGFFTKLAIRSNIIDLVNRIKQYRKQSMLKAKMKEIRTSFDGLLLKIIALLEDDPKLSRDLYVSRESIWESLLEVKA